MRRLHADRGSVTPLILAFVAILIGLLGVITDSSAAFLARRSLASAADGAALYAAGGLDRDRLYDATLTRLPLTPELAHARAAHYLAATHLAERYAGTRLGPVTLDPAQETVTVELSATVGLPFTGRLSGGRHSVRVRADASARSPLR